MIPIVCVIGDSGCGKTTFIEKLIPELKNLGPRVATLKHDARGHVDAPGKDSTRHATAGADMTAVVSDHLVTIFELQSSLPSLTAIVDTHFAAYDIVIAEGFKKENLPKIEVFRTAASRTWHAAPGERIAAVTDATPPDDAPVFGFDDAARLAAFLRDRFITNVSRSDARVWINGEYIELNPFVKAFVGQTVKGMVSALRGGHDAERIRIKIGR
jgi:molybdopterin-guanine dinucleotide biosynthesis adapter protein